MKEVMKKIVMAIVTVLILLILFGVVIFGILVIAPPSDNYSLGGLNATKSIKTNSN